MRTIQEVGLEILNHNPSKYYIFLGSEYAIKSKYIDIIADTYGGRHREVDSFEAMKKLTKGASLFPLEPSVFVIRYDETFVTQMSEITKTDLDYLSFPGTLVFVYESDKDAKKLDKFLPDLTVTFLPINKRLQKTYISRDYNFSDVTVDNILKLNYGYTRTNNICRSLSYIDNMDNVNYSNLVNLFSIASQDNLDKIQHNFAARNYRNLCILLDSDVNLNDVHYKLLSVVVELMKIKKSEYTESKFKSYANKWILNDLYNMFDIIYQELIKLRTISSDYYNSLLYIFTFLCYSKIPSVGDLYGRI